MRIVQLTPGAGGNFYCENCLRDNALVVELRRRGHDVLMVPLYLPLVTEGPDPSAGTPLFLGGINVYLQQKSSLFRRTPRWFDRLLDARPLLRWAARRAEMTKARDLGEPTLSMLRGEEGQQVKELRRLIEWLSGVDRPHLVSLSNVLLAGLVRPIKAALGVPVACTLQDEDIFLDALPPPYREQAWALVAERAAEIDAFLAASRTYADRMIRRLGLLPERVHVAPIGTDFAGYSPAETPPQPPVIGAVAQMNRAGGLDLLAEAFLAIRSRGRVPGVRLRAAGGHTPGDKPFVDAVRERLAAAGAADDAEFLPIPDRPAKQALLRTLSVLAVPARTGTAFERTVIEALASGVPVVASRLGALEELVEATGGGLLVDPEDPAALAAAIERLLLDPAEARRLADRGRAAALEGFSIERMAINVMRVFEAVA